MNNKKRLIMLITILIIASIIILLIINLLEKQNEKEILEQKELPTLTTNLDVSKVKNASEFFIVEECINTYFEALNENDSTGVYNLLNNKYMNQNGINDLNVLDRVYKLENGFEEFFVKDIYYKEISYDKEFQYYIYGEILGENYNSIETIYIIANLDFENMAFNVSFDKNIKVNEQEYLKIIENLTSQNTNEYISIGEQSSTPGVRLNDYNKFEELTFSDAYALDRYLKNYSIMAVYYPDIAYNLLDEEYRNKKFADLDEYKQYVANNKYRILNTTIKEINIKNNKEYDQYIILDTNGNYYIFKATDILKYTVITDFYTLDLDEIASKYDESNVQEKVAINIQKVISALNNRDYKYVYNKLSDSFKENYYPTLEDFINYMNTVTIINPEIIFKEFRNEGETYIYNINLKSSRLSAGAPISMQIIMRLEENRDFVMSFNINKEV